MSKKLLIITQKVDENDQLLGFSINWFRRFAERFDFIQILCLEKGKFSLPENVKVISLGKDSGASKIAQLFNFYRNIWRLRKQYDVVFVFMNAIWVVLGSWLWGLLGKRVFMWYAHKTITWKHRLAVKFANGIFTSTPEGFRIKSKKVMVVGQGIDMEIFKPDLSLRPDTLSILSVGRIAPIKNYEVLLRAAKILKDEGVNFRLNFIGEPVFKKDVVYEKELKNMVLELGLTGEVSFLGKVINKELPRHYQSSHIFINLGKTGSLDKTILEAMACGATVMSSNDAAIKFLPKELIVNSDSSEELAKKIKEVNKKDFGTQLRQYVTENHSLESLIDRIGSKLTNKHINSHLDNLEKFLGSFKDKKILDLGSGRGKFLVDCAKRCYETIGIELSHHKIEYSLERAKREGVEINVKKGEAESIDLEDNSIDFVNASEVIEHVKDPRKVLKEIFRVLKRGGQVYMSVHNRFSFYDTHFHIYLLGWLPRKFANAYIGMFRKHKDYQASLDLQNIKDMHYFTFSDFKNLAKSYGFEVKEIREEKIRRKYGRSVGVLYRLVLRPFYMSTFHFLLEKPKNLLDVGKKFDSIVKEKSAGDYEHHRWFKTPLLKAGFDMTKEYIKKAVVPFSDGYKSYLELGPGPGTWTKFFLDKNKHAAYTLIDISEEMLGLAKDNLKNFDNVAFIESDFMNWNADFNPDFFFSSRVIEYIEDKDKFVKKMADLMKAGAKGAIITKMPHYKRSGRKLGPLHSGQIAPERIEELFVNNGFSVEGVHCVTANFPMLRSASVNRIISRFCTGKNMNWFRSIFSESYGVIFKKL